ncbi:response regulator [Alteromonas oceanisediminis]|uniref:response regulator n=1 Tax=Alteromonas oceanisediminis TaxID=2836180 RepID=UPI001BDABD62|nr:response regulator [Alteromonas oceanisediminis]MBT0585609.1 response regulator [Alteromonas oceanisediminis]
MSSADRLQKRVRALDYILVADDDTDDQELVKEALMQTGLLETQIRFVGDGEELLSALNCARVLPNLILLDLNMPRKGGKEVLSNIRVSEKLKHVPVIMFSTSSLSSDVHDCFQLGASAYMTKPFQYSELVEAMQALITFWVGHSQVVQD